MDTLPIRYARSYQPVRSIGGRPGTLSHTITASKFYLDSILDRQTCCIRNNGALFILLLDYGLLCNYNRFVKRMVPFSTRYYRTTSEHVMILKKNSLLFSRQPVLRSHDFCDNADRNLIRCFSDIRETNRRVDARGLLFWHTLFRQGRYS